MPVLGRPLLEYWIVLLKSAGIKRIFINVHHLADQIIEMVSAIKDNDIENLHVYRGDAIEIVEEYFSNNILDEILIFFPDPWPKRKHKKRRILNQFSLELFLSKLKNNGIIHFATDHINYAYTVKDLMTSYTKKKISFNNNRRFRPITNYEVRGLKRNNFFFDIVLEK